MGEYLIRCPICSTTFFCPHTDEEKQRRFETGKEIPKAEEEKKDDPTSKA